MEEDEGFKKWVKEMMDGVVEVIEGVEQIFSINKIKKWGASNENIQKNGIFSFT